MRSAPVLAVAFLALAPLPAWAQDACGAFKWSIQREKEAFGGGNLSALSTKGIYPAPGTAVTVNLAPQGEVAYTVKPKRAPKAVPAHGAELVATISQAGSYQATVSSDAWIDMAQNGQVLHPNGFSGVTGCPGVRKSVRFELAAGPLTIALSDAADSSLKLDIVPVQ